MGDRLVDLDLVVSAASVSWASLGAVSRQDPRLPDNVTPLRPADAEHVLQDLAAIPDLMRVQVLERLAPEPWQAPEQSRCFTVRVALDDLEPPIWRQLALAGDLTLAELHDVLQVAMGWTDSHLHHFLMGPGERDFRRLPFVEPYAESEGHDGLVERDVRLDQVVAEPGHRLYYDYDFGDGWEHTVEVESVAPLDPEAPRARCLAGHRACPPEDVGGIPGYEEVLDALDRPSARRDEWLTEKLGWLPIGFDPALFDLPETDALVRRASEPAPALPHPDQVPPELREVVSRLGNQGADLAARWVIEALPRAGSAVDLDAALDTETSLAVTAAWRALLAAVGDGLTLTGAGYLPPAVVSALVVQLDLQHLWGKGNREEHTPPVAHLHESARSMGLVRKAKGRLLPTALGKRLREDPDQLARHVVSRLAISKKHYGRDAEWLLVLAVAAGVEEPYSDVARLLSGAGWSSDVGPMQWHHAYHAAHHTRTVLGLAGWNPGRYDDLVHDPRARVLAQLALRP